MVFLATIPKSERTLTAKHLWGSPWPVWLRGQCVSLRTVGSQVRFPFKGMYLSCRFDPQPGVGAPVGGNQLMFFPHINVSPLSPSLPFSVLKKKKKSVGI